jgi:hypothetical protein
LIEHCIAWTKEGKACRAWAMTGSAYCFWHHLDYEARRKAASSKGGKATLEDMERKRRALRGRANRLATFRT